MCKNNIKIKAKIVFDPVDKTKKHKSQSTWKRMAMIMIEDEITNKNDLFKKEDEKMKYVGITSYYNWFLKNKYGFTLNKPLRGAHISFINDSVNDIMKGMKCSEKEAIKAWEELSLKWNGKEIDVSLDVDVRSDGKHWWLIVSQDKREEIHEIRKEVGLERPYFGLHMSIGYANNKNIDQSRYILSGIEKGFIN